MRAGGFAAAAAFVLLATVAPVQASHTAPGSVTPATLYFHTSDGDYEFPVTTQVPPENWTAWGPAGVAAATFSCVVSPGMPIASERHSVYGYSAAESVSYEGPDGRNPQAYGERRLPYDIQVDLLTPWVLHWYVMLAPPAGVPPAAGLPAPTVVVEASVRADAGPMLRDDYDKAALVANGRSNATTLYPGVAGHSKTPDGRDVYAFEVRLEPRLSAIPAADGYLVRIDTYMENPACSDGRLTPSHVRWYSDATRRPRMTLGVLDALRVVSVSGTLGPGGLAVVAEVESPWGLYDVDPGGVVLNVSGAPPGAFHAQVVDQRVRAHQYPPAPFRAAWVWASPSPGAYGLAVEATNLQHTAKAQGTSEITVPGEEAPAPGAAALLLALLAAGAWMVARRDRRP